MWINKHLCTNMDKPLWITVCKSFFCWKNLLLVDNRGIYKQLSTFYSQSFFYLNQIFHNELNITNFAYAHIHRT